MRSRPAFMSTSSSLLASWVAHEGDAHPIAHDARGTTSYADAFDRAERVASVLLDGRASLEGERVGMLVAPGADFAACFFGVLRSGGAVVVLSPLHPPARNPLLLRGCGNPLHPGFRRAGAPGVVPLPERRVLLAENAVLSLRRPIAASPCEDDAALQLYTSGTTGTPKGAVISHRSLAAQQRLLGDAWGWQRSDVLLHVLPLHHIHGLAIAWLSAVGAGAATRFLGSFEAHRVWNAMADTTVFMAVPTIHAKLFAAFDAADEATRRSWTSGARSLRLVTSGSAALPVTVGRRWTEAHGRLPARALRHDRDRRRADEPARPVETAARCGRSATAERADARGRR